MKTFGLENNISEAYEKQIDMLFSYYSDVFHYLSVFDIGAAEIEDAVQDTYIEALTYLDKLRDITKMKFWLLKIAKRVGIKYAVKRKKRIMNESTIEDYKTMPEPGTADVPDKQLCDLVEKMNREELWSLLRRLSDKELKILLLHFAYGYKFKDIAKMVGESDTNTRSISKRARDKLRAMAEKEGIGFDL